MNATPDDKHRPWPAPRTPWLMRQIWNRVLFAHWKIPADSVRRALPRALRSFLDVDGAHAWVGVVGFQVTGSRLRGLPVIPRVSDFFELNVRTYLTLGGKPGVYFFSLDTFHFLAVAGARAFFNLPYHTARTRWGEGAGRFLMKSERFGTGRASWEARYRPVSPPVRADENPLTAFLTERYCLYTATDRGDVQRAEIHHQPWLLSEAEAEIPKNTMLAALDFPEPQTPALCHFAEAQEAFIWAPERVGTVASVAVRKEEVFTGF